MGTFFPVRPHSAVSGEPLPDQRINKHREVLSCILGHVFGMAAQLLKKVVYGMFAVKKLPYKDARGVEAKTATRIWIEEYGPVVKLLPEYDVRVADGFVAVLHKGSTCSSSAGIALTGTMQ
jgi:hypothetical protein